MRTLAINPIKQQFMELTNKKKTVLYFQEYARQTANSIYHTNIPEPNNEMGQYVKELVYWNRFWKENYQKIHEGMKLRKFNIEG